MTKRILVTGGAGYLGSRLIPQLVKKYEVVVIDNCWFHTPDERRNLALFKADIRDLDAVKIAMEGVDTVIHLACISNDASFELDPKLSMSINQDAFLPLVRAAKNAGVQRFIYASSSSVYGVSSKERVTEESALMPLTAYSSSKAWCEVELWGHQSPDFVCTVVRPATLCGYSPRMRFDLMVNSFVNQAVRNAEIVVRGGTQRRASLHVDDMVDAYEMLIEAPADKIAGQVFNVGIENLTIMQIARLVTGHVMSSIAIEPTEDLRSYHIDSEKIYHVLGFRPTRITERAISEMCARFQLGEWKDSLENPKYMNLDQYRAANVS